MLYALSRWWREQREIRYLMRDFRPRTGRVAFVILACALVAWVLLIAVARAEPQTLYVCTEADPLNVRDAPSLHAPWVYRLDRGEAVTVHEVQDDWVYVEWVGQYGWCWSAYLGDRPPADKLPEEFLEVEME